MTLSELMAKADTLDDDTVYQFSIVEGMEQTHLGMGSEIKKHAQKQKEFNELKYKMLMDIIMYGETKIELKLTP